MKIPKPKTRRSPAQRRRRASIIGALFLLFAAVGIVSTAMYLQRSVSNFLDDSASRERYERFISPVVMVDPAPFSMVENLEDDLLLQSAMWAALTGENRGAYTYDENGLLLVPSSDLDVAAARLYGPDAHVIHRSFDDTDASYLFDPDISAYRVPSISKVAYSPFIESIVEEPDGRLTLTVGYVPPGNLWTTDVTGEQSDEPRPEKSMLYTLTKWDQGYYVSAVNYLDSTEAPRS